MRAGRSPPKREACRTSWRCAWTGPPRDASQAGTGAEKTARRPKWPNAHAERYRSLFTNYPAPRRSRAKCKHCNEIF